MAASNQRMNPFDVTPDTPGPFVAVSGGRGPYANTTEALSHFSFASLKGAKVLLKPNAGRAASSESGVVTNPEVVAAAIDVFRKAGATVAVGESPIVGIKAQDSLQQSGIAAVANERGCRVLDFDARTPKEVYIPDGSAINKLRVCADVFDYNLLVSLPVIKMHMHTGVTLSVKNMKGCLYHRSKVELHMLPRPDNSYEKPLNVAIADMSSVLRPHFAIIDGTIGMEGLGPSAGEPKRLDTIVCSADPFAADAVACTLIGTNAAEIAHLRIGAERGYGIIDLAYLTIHPPDWKKWHQPFAAAPDTISIKFPNIEVLDNKSCSACQSTVLLFLKRYGKDIFDYFPDAGALQIAIGKGHSELPPQTLCIGNCTAPHSENRLFVRGCPPVASAIWKCIQDKSRRR
ncbi:MAG: DUF362 domain-containing protein [Chitinivibrionales bacterium]|nr:DUF362 domain-containing protein [Chitinivibrionales bacterium]